MVTEFLGHRRIPNRVPSPVDVLHFCRCTGFETAIVKSVSVVAETTTLELKLRIGKPNENVEVSDAADLAQTESATLGRAIDERAIESLPLANCNYTQLIALSPGVVAELPNAAALGRNNQNVSANGSKTMANNIQFNGIDANNLSQNSASGYQSEVGTAVPSQDTIEEFKVQTGNYDAGYGRGAGANVDLISHPILDRNSGPAFGLITSTVANPRLIQLALRYEF